MNKDVKPCPFCGGEADIKINYRPNYVVGVCLSCGSQGVRKQKIYEAIYCWNTRAKVKDE
jgi:Lar family restriction alleviation protein